MEDEKKAWRLTGYLYSARRRDVCGGRNSTEPSHPSDSPDPRWSHTLDFRNDEHTLSLVVVYVDDLTLAFRSLSALVFFKEKHSSIYLMRTTGETTRTLNIQVERDRPNRNHQAYLEAGHEGADRNLRDGRL